MKKLLFFVLLLPVIFVFIHIFQYSVQAVESLTFTEVPLNEQIFSFGDVEKGPDNSFWFSSTVIGKVTLTGQVSYYNGPDGSGTGYRVTYGNDGKLWFDRWDSPNITMVSINSDGQEEVFNVLSNQSYSFMDLVAGADNELWILSHDKIGWFDTSTHLLHWLIAENKINGSPSGFAYGPDENIWFGTTRAVDNKHSLYVNKLTRYGEVSSYLISELENPAPTDFGNIIAGPDGNIWVNDNYKDNIAKVSTDGNVTLYPIPGEENKECFPMNLVNGPDGNIWFSCFGDMADTIFRVTKEGIFTPFPRNEHWGPLVAGPDGNVWIFHNERLTKLNIAAAPPSPTPIVVSGELCIEKLHVSTSNTTMSKLYRLEGTVKNPSQYTSAAEMLHISEDGVRKDYNDTSQDDEKVFIPSLPPGGTEKFRIYYGHGWNWLLPVEKKGKLDTELIPGLLSVNKVLDIIGQKGTKVLNAAFDIIEIIKNKNLALPAITYTYTPSFPACEGNPDNEQKVTVNVPDTKTTSLLYYYSLKILSGKLFSVGLFSAFTPGGAPAALLQVGGALAAKLAANEFLEIAVDPDPAYTEVVQPVIQPIPNSESFTGENKTAFTHAATAIANIRAAGKAMSKSYGAIEAQNDEWTVKQFFDSRRFLTTAYYEMTGFLVNAGFLYEGQMKYVADSNSAAFVADMLIQQGWPEIVRDGLDKSGYNEQQITDERNTQLMLMPAITGYYASSPIHEDLLQSLSDLKTEIDKDIGVDIAENIDIQPPVSTISVQGTKGTGAWYISPVRVTITAQDTGGSGIEKVEYSIDDGATWKVYDSPIHLSTDGIHTVLSRASDKQGNTELPPQTTSFSLDSTSPEILISFDPAMKKIVANGTDTGSGIDSVLMSGKEIKVTDKAGNTTQLFIQFNKVSGTNRNGRASMTLTSLVYNSGVIKIPKTNINIVWVSDKNGTLKHLVQTYIINGKSIAHSSYSGSTDISTTIWYENGKKVEMVRRQGMSLIGLHTDKSKIILEFH